MPVEGFFFWSRLYGVYIARVLSLKKKTKSISVNFERHPKSWIGLWIIVIVYNYISFFQLQSPLL